MNGSKPVFKAILRHSTNTNKIEFTWMIVRVREVELDVVVVQSNLRRVVVLVVVVVIDDDVAVLDELWR